MATPHTSNIHSALSGCHNKSHLHPIFEAVKTCLVEPPFVANKAWVPITEPASPVLVLHVSAYKMPARPFTKKSKNEPLGDPKAHLHPQRRIYVPWEENRDVFYGNRPWFCVGSEQRKCFFSPLSTRLIHPGSTRANRNRAPAVFLLC